MKKNLLTILALCIALACGAQGLAADSAQSPEGYTFTDTKVLPTTPIKDQSRSGTCWCFATNSFLEGEILRAGGDPIHLSEMWIVRNMLMDKAVKYIRMHGNLNFAEGGAAHDVTEGIKAHGIVPFDVYPGLNYGTTKPDFHELTAVLKGYLEAVIAAANRSGKPLSTAWQRGFDALLDTYFGEKPESFNYKGTVYTPESFVASLPININDYVNISSFTHHPFYTQFIQEVPDNWLWATSHNLPLEEMMQVVDNALSNNYPVMWATDISEKSFSRTKAIGIIPEVDLEGMGGTEAEKWGQLSAAEKDASLYSFDKPGKEKTITQEFRQQGYDNHETTDDHGMVIIGTAVDQNGNHYFKAQNSWDVRAPYDGYFYFSRPFVESKTMTLMVNKNAIPKQILKKMGIK